MNWRETENTNYIVALDIGTTKVCVVVGRKNDLNQVQILAHARVNGEGVQRGVISNIDKVVKSIKSAVRKAEGQIGNPITKVTVGIAGQHIKSRQNHNVITRENSQAEIKQADLDELSNSMRKLPLSPGEEILHIIPRDYAVDDEWGISEPIGMCGTRLSANFHIITCLNTASKNIIRCVRKAGLEITALTFEPIASSESVLTEADRKEGVVLIDIGGGTTDLTIFSDGVISHTSVVAFGGNVITSDISQVFNITTKDAEELKVKFGNALHTEATQNRYIRIANRRGQNHTEIPEVQLAEVIHDRLEEILDYVGYQIELSGVKDRLQGGIVLTGGGSLLENIDKLTDFHTGIPTRIGYPVEHLAHGYDSELSSPIFSTSIGLLIGGLDTKTKSSNSQSLIQDTPEPKPETSPKPETPSALQKKSRSTVSDQGELTNNLEEQDGWFSKASKNLVSSIKNWFEDEEEPDLE